MTADGSTTTKRVVAWSTGTVGRHAIAGIDARPDLELVGVWVSSDEKVGKDAGELAGLRRELSVIATNDKADQTAYTPLQKKTVEFVKSAKSIAQFLDRDTRPDFASTVMIPAIQSFIKTPDDIDGLVKNIQQQKLSIFTS